MRRRRTLTRETEGSALVEFAIALPLLVVFLVGIYDFSGAFNQKQKIGHAAQEAAVIAGAQPMTDMDPAAPATANPYSLQPVLEVVFSSLSADNVLPQGTWASCAVAHNHLSELKWSFTITGCTPDSLVIAIDRGWVTSVGGPPTTVGTQVTVSYPYHWRFNSVIQLLVPGAIYAATTNISETATVHNQM